MRALISHVQLLENDPNSVETYALWQLGCPEQFSLTVYNMDHVSDLISVLRDRSKYLNRILSCTETLDAIVKLHAAETFCNLVDDADFNADPLHAWVAEAIGHALWCYEVRAYRRKQEEVNRLHPAHDDTERPKPWRDTPFADVPFGPEDIHLRPIGPDGHIVLK